MRPGLFSTMACVLTTAMSALACTPKFSADEPVFLQGTFYAGLDVGVANLMDQMTVSPAYAATRPQGVGVVAGGLFGYNGPITERASLGLEGFINANGLNAATIYPETSYRVNSRYNAGFRVLPTYQFMRCSNAHLILGYANARLELTDNGTWGFLHSIFNKSGYQLGAGFTHQLHPRLALRLDGLYTGYSGQTNPATPLRGSMIAPWYKNQFSTVEANVSALLSF